MVPPSPLALFACASGVLRDCFAVPWRTWKRSAVNGPVSRKRRSADRYVGTPCRSVPHHESSLTRRIALAKWPRTPPNFSQCTRSTLSGASLDCRKVGFSVAARARFGWSASPATTQKSAVYPATLATTLRWAPRKAISTMTTTTLNPLQRFSQRQHCTDQLPRCQEPEVGALTQHVDASIPAERTRSFRLPQMGDSHAPTTTDRRTRVGRDDCAMVFQLNLPAQCQLSPSSTGMTTASASAARAADSPGVDIWHCGEGHGRPVFNHHAQRCMNLIDAVFPSL